MLKALVKFRVYDVTDIYPMFSYSWWIYSRSPSICVLKFDDQVKLCTEDQLSRCVVQNEVMQQLVRTCCLQ